MNLSARNDAVAQGLTGLEGMTAQRLKAELEVLLGEDDPDVRAAIERQQMADAEKTAEAKSATETPEQKEIREWREERERSKIQEVTQSVMTPIESAVDELVSQAGLEIKQSEYQGKNFDELDPDTQFKGSVRSLERSDSYGFQYYKTFSCKRGTESSNAAQSGGLQRCGKTRKDRPISSK